MGVLGGAAAFPAYGWRGLAGIGAGVAIARLDAPWAPSAASILVWWGLAFALDAGVFRKRGQSPLHDEPDVFVWMAVLSIFLGVGLEWSAGRLAVWSYLGLPFNEFVRYGVQGAVFAAYLPALHGAAGLCGADSQAAARPQPGPRWTSTLGLLLGGGLMACPLGVRPTEIQRRRTGSESRRAVLARR